MADFLEYQSVAFDINKITDSDTIAAVDSENLYSTKLQKPFKETYLKDFLYYNDTTKTFEQRTNNSKGVVFENKLKTKILFSPSGKNGGFIAFGGYNIGKLPDRGRDGINSGDYSVENEVLYLKTRRYNKNTESWIRLDLDNGVFEDIVYGDKSIESAFNVYQDENDIELINIPNNSKWFVDKYVFTGNGESSFTVDLRPIVSKSLAAVYKNSEIITTGYSSTISGDTLTINFDNAPLNTDIIMLAFSQVLSFEDFVTNKNGIFINRINEVSTNAQGCLDIPEQIEGQDIKELQLVNPIEYTNQVILPRQDLFIFGNETFAKNGYYNDLKLLRLEPDNQYNLKYNDKENIDIQTTNNIFVLSDKSLINSQIKHIDNITNNYSKIYYGLGCLENSKIKSFTIKNTDVYPNENINFAIINTPYLQKYNNSINGYSDDSDKGILYKIDDNKYKIKSISSYYINSIPKEEKNTIKISQLVTNLTENSTNISAKLENYCLLSPNQQIHTLVFDEDSKISSLEIEGNAFYVFKDSKINKVIIDSAEYLISNNNALSLNILLDNNATLKWNTFNNSSATPLLGLTYKNLESRFLFNNTDQNVGNFENININTEIVYERNENDWDEVVPNLTFSKFNFNKGIISGRIKNTNPAATVSFNDLDISNIYNFEARQINFVGMNNLVVNSRQLVFNNSSVNNILDLSNLKDLETLTIKIENGDDSVLSFVGDNYLKKVKKIDINYFGVFTLLSELDNDFNKNYFTFGAIGNRALIYTKKDTLPTSFNVYTLEQYKGTYTINTEIEDDTFKDLPKLKELYLPNELIVGNKIKNGAFYKNAPIDIYVYIYEDEDYLKTPKTLEDYFGATTQTAFNSTSTAFPNYSNIYFYNLNSNTYRIRYIDKYKANRQQSNRISDLEYYNYFDIERWGNYINRMDENEEVNNNES